MEIGQVKQAAGVQPVHRCSPVPKGRRAFAMKRHMYAGLGTHAHACDIVVRNRFGVWSRRNQKYIRKTRYFKFVALGSAMSKVRRKLQEWIKQHGLLTWAQYSARREELEAAEAGLQKLFHRRMPARFRKLKRRVVKEREWERRLLLKKQAHAAQAAREREGGAPARGPYWQWHKAGGGAAGRRALPVAAPKRGGWRDAGRARHQAGRPAMARAAERARRQRRQPAAEDGGAKAAARPGSALGGRGRGKEEEGRLTMSWPARGKTTANGDGDDRGNDERKRDRLEGERESMASGNRGRRRQLWKGSPAHGGRRPPMAEFDGGGVDEVELGHANPTAATAWCGGDPSGG
uniref:Uncharacterized protein n=1 Tax=Oryza sativa subsp. japonica TaxID=39947 RepID=Q6ZGI8_ORYSJ|nr:hypothetical protein [Oryza sativa Japonica Group]BAD16944.1 hypothetical protein [Oryza sativa Japonica Group]